MAVVADADTWFHRLRVCRATASGRVAARVQKNWSLARASRESAIRLVETSGVMVRVGDEIHGLGGRGVEDGHCTLRFSSGFSFDFLSFSSSLPSKAFNHGQMRGLMAPHGARRRAGEAFLRPTDFKNGHYRTN